VRLTTTCDGTPQVIVDPAHIRQELENLVANGVRHTRQEAPYRPFPRA
jgi:hypothetical protein